MGPYERASQMMGTIGMSYLLSDDPELVEMVFKKISSLHIASNRILSQMDKIGVHRQGDDLGFNTATFLPPELLRRFVFPVYKGMADIAHAAEQGVSTLLLFSCINVFDFCPHFTN